jgi:hypothetical protein
MNMQDHWRISDFLGAVVTCVLAALLGVILGLVGVWVFW